MSAPWFCCQKYIWLCSLCIQNLKTLAQIEAEKSVTENFVREKEKWTNKISNMLLILDYTVQLVIPNVCIKFQNPKSSSF